MELYLSVGILLNVKRQLEAKNFSTKIESYSLTESDLQYADDLLTQQCTALLPLIQLRKEPKSQDDLDLTLALLFFMRVEQFKTLIHFVAKRRMNIEWYPNYNFYNSGDCKVSRHFKGENIEFRQTKWIDFYNSCGDKLNALPHPKPVNECILMVNLSYLILCFEKVVHFYVFNGDLPVGVDLENISMSGEFKFYVRADKSTYLEIIDFYNTYKFKNEYPTFKTKPHPEIEPPKYKSKARSARYNNLNPDSDEYNCSLK